MSHRLPVADIQFIARFAEFCRGKPAAEHYDFLSPKVCAVAQFGYPDLYDTGCAEQGGEQVAPEIAMDAACKMPWTWGSLADRLEALIADAPAVERVS